MSYVSAGELKTALNLQGTQHADPDVELAIAAASQGLDAEYGGPFTGGEPGEVRYMRPSLERELRLGAFLDVEKVEVDRYGDGGFVELVRDVDYVLEPSNAGAAGTGFPFRRLRLLRSGTVLTFGRFPRRVVEHEDTVRVTGTPGWAEPPEGLKTATLIVGARLLQRIRTSPHGVIQIGVDGAAVRAQKIARDPDVRFVMRDVAGPRRLVV